MTLSDDLLHLIDEHTRQQPGRSRSAVVEEWLRRAARDMSAERLEEETIRYFRGQTEEERAEDGEWVEFATREAARVRE